MLSYPSLDRFNKYKKWKCFFDKNCVEFPISILITFLIVISLYFLDFYSSFQYFQEGIKNICLYIVSSLIGLIGILLAGIAFITSLFNQDKKEILNKINKPGSIENILVSFEFLAFIIGIQVFEFFIIYLILHSPKEIISEFIFYIVFILSTYFFTFTIFYTISLVGNCIKLYSIVADIGKISNMKSKIISKANEIRIDFILKLILDTTSAESSENFVKDLERYVDENDIDDKEALKAYFRNYYR